MENTENDNEYVSGQNEHDNDYFQEKGDDNIPEYENLNFKSEEDDISQAQLFALMEKEDKLRKLKVREKEEVQLDIDANKIDRWVDYADNIIHLADICQRDGSLDPINLDNVLINVFKMKQLTEHIRLHSNYIVKYGKAGITVPYSNLYTNVSVAIEHVKAGIVSDKKLSEAISSMFLDNKSLITTDNDTGLSIDDILEFKNADDEIDDNFNIETKLVYENDVKTIVVSNILNIVDIAASLFVIEKAEITVESDVLVVSRKYKRSIAFKNMCAMISSMIVMFIVDDTIDYSLLDRRS